MRVNSERLRSDLTSLGQIGRSTSGGLNRTSYSAADSEARRWYQQRCDEAGLELRLDGLGNMFARAPSDNREAAAVWTGSHIDTVPDGGAFDGAVGAVAALECVRRIHEEQIQLARPVQAVVFADEEGNYAHLLGSTGLAQGYDSAELAELRGRDGDLLTDALHGCNWTSGSPTATRIDPRDVHTFLELHIEQGPRLETEHIDIGVVTGIVGIGGGAVEFLGRADHAGTTPMDQRRDALSAAAAFLHELPELAASVNPQMVITCGILTLEPGGANVIPGTVRLSLDFRGHDLDDLAALDQHIGRAARAAADRYRCTATWKAAPLVEPVRLDPAVQGAIKQSADEHQLTSIAMPSGAGHDSQNMARLAPTGMIFVPSTDGRSHCPQEHSSWQDISNGANVLLASLLRLAAE